MTRSFAICIAGLALLPGFVHGSTNPVLDQTPLHVSHEYAVGASSQQYLGDRKMRNYVVDAAGRWTVRTPKKIDSSKIGGKLLPLAFDPLPLGSIKPLGWMKDEVQLMVDGLPGNLHTFYRHVQNGTWVGDDHEYSRLNEAWPYWYNGIVALAYGADDENLQGEVDKVTRYVLKHQFKDGWLGPEEIIKKRNFWGRTPFLLGLMQLIQVQGDELAKPALDAIHRFVELAHKMLRNEQQGYVWHPGDDFDQQWGRSRAADMVMFLQWLYEEHPRNNTRIIHECMVEFYNYSFDWTYWFQDGVFGKQDFDHRSEGDVRGSVFPYIHVVNAGQGLKYGAVMQRLTHMEKYVQDTYRGTNYTFTYHGAPSGAIIGDEGESGTLPHRGAELCGVVETIYSLTYNYQALGSRYYADRAELAAYNALPVMITPDWWAHQYVATINQPAVHYIDQPPFWNVGPRGTMFGLEPHYPCCTVNHGQGLPKYLSAAYVKRGRDEIVHAILMPAEVKTILGQNDHVDIRCETNYPFEHTLKYTIQAASDFKFAFRVPEWVDGITVGLNNVVMQEDLSHVSAEDGLFTIPISSGRSTIEVSFSATPRIEKRVNDTVSILHGTLLYALPVPARWSSERPEHYPDTTAPRSSEDHSIIPNDDFKWNIAIDPSTIEVHYGPENERGQPLPSPIWNVNAISTVRISVMACEVSNWEYTTPKGGYAPPPPPTKERKYSGKAFRVFLQPYGALKVHMAEFPSVNLEELGLI